MLNRRKFLSGSCALGATAAFGPSALALQSDHSPSLPGYRALVCINLAGGNDGYNMLVPSCADGYSLYKRIRQNVALSQESLLPLPRSCGDSAFGLHPDMVKLRDIVHDGDALIVANVGRPAADNSDSSTAADSHRSNIQAWQTCAGQQNFSSGWAGRASDLLHGDAIGGELPMNISVGRANLLQVGNLSQPCNLNLRRPRSPGAPVGVEFGYINEILAQQAMRSQQQAKRRFLGRTQDRMQSNFATGAIEPLHEELAARFGKDELATGLMQTAAIIAARQHTHAKRQIFFINVDGWDHHDKLLSHQSVMLRQLSEGLDAFRATLLDLDAFDDVTTFTTSEFGRSLVPNQNGRGTDHGWSNHHIVMGGSIDGSKIVGNYPELSPALAQDATGGAIAPTVSFDEYFAELVRWLGVPSNQLGNVFPDLARIQKTASQLQSIDLFA